MEENNNTVNKNKNTVNKNNNTVNKNPNFKRKTNPNLQKYDLLKISSSDYNDYFKDPIYSWFLGMNKSRPAFIVDEIISPNNEKYFMVTLGTTNPAKKQVEFYVDESGERFTLNPTETYIYKEKVLQEAQNRYIGRADLTNLKNYNFLTTRINESIPTRDELKKTISLIKDGNIKKADRLIERQFPKPTKEESWNKKVYNDARELETDAQKEEYINKNLDKYPWLDDEPSE